MVVKKFFFFFFLLLFSYILISCSKETRQTSQKDSSVVVKKDSIDYYSNRMMVDRDYLIPLPDSIADVIEKAGFCRKDTSIRYSTKDTTYNYCDVCCFQLFPLVDDWDKYFLLEIKYRGTGSGGNHYYFLKKVKEDYKRVNFFMGYLDTVKYHRPYNDIVFYYFDQLPYDETNGKHVRQWYKLLYRWKSGKYKCEKLLEVTNQYQDTTVVLEKYDPEMNNPKNWDSLIE